MKKILVLILLLVPVVLLFGCKVTDTPDPVPDNQGDQGGTNQGDNNQTNTNQGDNNPGDNTQTNTNQGDEITYLTVSEAYQLAQSAGDVGTSEKQYVMGVVKNITKPAYGEMYITDGTTDLYIYGVYSADGTLRYSEMDDKPYSGDTVYLYGVLKTYKGQPEMGAAWLQKYEAHQEDTDLNNYTQKTINEARLANAGEKIIVEGVVAKLTYANGMNPNGIFVVDETGSIYVYGIELANRVEVGQKVKVAGTRTNYILDSEVTYATQYGYLGSIQLQDAIYISSSSEKYDFDKSWISETTVKDIIDTPLTNNITTNIYKVTALVKKAPGSGYVNYYIDDLDNHTGTYCYSLCNGSDFSWLDQYDGKICTVYVSALNCKCAKAGTNYRFIPIAVEEIADFSMTDSEIAKFALNYYAKLQFRSLYNSDPELVLLESVSNDVIPFENVFFSYASNNENLVYFEETQDQELIMHTKDGDGEVTITITASFNGVRESIDVVLTLESKEIPDTISVKEAIEAADNTKVTVRGIVMSGLVVQTGFYINDGTGVIAVRCDSDTIKEINLGDEVIISGTKTHVLKAGTTGQIGQICIDEAKLELNLFGDNDYSTTPFKEITFNELYELMAKINEDYTTQVYVVKCHVIKYETNYYTNYELSDDATGTHYLTLYSANKSQYAPYEVFIGKGEVTVTVMLCNWNSKSPYKGCLISVTDGTTSVLNDYNFR